jgi:hypothetical protein
VRVTQEAVAAVPPAGELPAGLPVGLPAGELPAEAGSPDAGLAMPSDPLDGDGSASDVAWGDPLHPASSPASAAAAVTAAALRGK